MKGKFLTIIFVALTSSVNAQDLATIRGEFANITAEKSDSADVLCQLEELDLFLVDSVDDGWLAIRKPTYMQPVKGFLPKSRARYLREMSNSDKRILIKGIYDTELELVKSENFEALKAHHEPRFDQVLGFASQFIVDTKDSELLQTFIQTIKLDDGSADERPSTWLGWIYLQQPDWTITQIKKVGPDELFLSHLKFGFDNVVYEKKGYPEQFARLKAKLEALK